MPRTSERERTLRTTRTALLRAFLLGRSLAWDGLNSDVLPLDSAQSNSSSQSSSLTSSDGWDTDSTSSSMDMSSSGAASSMIVSSDSAMDDFEFVIRILQQLESRRVLNERRTPRGMERLVDRLHRLQTSTAVGDAVFYRHLVRMKPDAFVTIVKLLEPHEMFAVKDPRRAGASVAEQAAVAFYWMGRYGNGGGVVDVAFVCGCAEGSVVKYVGSVCKVLYDMRDQTLCWASNEEKEIAKAWVAAQSECVDFSGGYSMVDGSLVPLAFKPGKKAYHREYFDRKSQYSLNIQLVVLPTTYRVIDYVVGYKGATQDSRAFAASDIMKRPGIYLEAGEFVWADGGYGLSEHTCGPYDHVVAAKSRDFRRFNYTVSKVRVRSEHAFGYLKGRFQCLRGLRQLVRDEVDHDRITTTIVGALVAHNLALRWDRVEERRTFIDLSMLSEEAAKAWEDLDQGNTDQTALEREAWTRRVNAYEARASATRDRLQSQSQTQRDQDRRLGAKAVREKLHKALFTAKDWEFEDTTEQSRLHDRTEAEYQRWLAKKAEAAANRRALRQQQARGRGRGRGQVRGRGRGRGGTGAAGAS
ncbi:hypothetical protein CF335_g7570 [Tilletia laevis]|nr:hypothetical protein CF335_g7570 [Tilletia laevis]